MFSKWYEKQMRKIMADQYSKFWEWFMKRSYRKSQSSIVHQVPVKDFNLDFKGFIKRAKVLGKIGAANYVSDRLYGAVNRIDRPDLALKRLYKFEEDYNPDLARQANTESYDCDDHASAILFLGSEVNSECYLLTYFTTKINEAHTIPLFIEEGTYWVLDWNLSIQAVSLEVLLDEIQDIRKIEIASVHFAKFDYMKGQYISVPRAEVIDQK